GIVHGGRQSLPMDYDNSTASVSEATRTFDAPMDWTGHGVQSLSLYFHGDSANSGGQLYVKINNTKIPYDGDAGDLGRAIWQPWNIDLSTAGGNLMNVTSLTIGVEGAGATGVVYIDDIGLYPLAPQFTVPAEPDVANLVARHTFDGNANDTSGNGHKGTPVGAVTFVNDPVRGQVVSLPGGDDQYISIEGVGISGNMPRTIACWAKADSTTITDWTLIFGFTGTAAGGGGNGSHFNIGSLGGPGGVGAHVWGWEETIFSDEEALEWHHYAMTYDGTTIGYYGDGVPMDTDVGKSNVRDLSASSDRVHVGSRITQTSSFPGSVDDAVIYSVTLTDGEIAWLAGRTAPMHRGF
ncbi:MAG: LamG domain-containing protein, partial [Planctomycetes bacterium]|nr:LamG domain-containing protein [Planctomycetota bacterium]